jgi:hypothetical protein
MGGVNTRINTEIKGGRINAKIKGRINTKSNKGIKTGIKGLNYLEN